MVRIKVMACTATEWGGYLAPAIRSMYYKISIANLLKVNGRYCQAGIFYEYD